MTAIDVNEPLDFDKLWDFRDPKGTAEKFRARLAEVRETEPKPYVAILLTQLARTEGMQRRFEEAHVLLDEAEALLRDEDRLARVRLLLERGRTLNSSKKRDEATVLFREALELAKAIPADFYALDAIHMLGISEPPERALEHNLAAIEIAQATKSERARRWLGALYNNTGWTYFEKGEHAEALGYFRKNLAYRDEIGAHNGIATWSVAKALRVLGEVEEALAMQRALLARYEAEKTPDGFVHEEIAECLWRLDRKDEAKPFLAKAYLALKEIAWVAADEPERVESLRARAGLPKPTDAAGDAPIDDEDADHPETSGDAPSGEDPEGAAEQGDD